MAKAQISKNSIVDEINSPKIDRLILKYALPAIISGITGALYNIIDQAFIGNIVGVQGNAATNVTFPLLIFVIAIMLCFGLGGTANFSLSLGRKDMEKAKSFVGTMLSSAFISGIAISLVSILFSEQFLTLFGATKENFDYANIYLRITAIGFPFFIMIEVGARLIRADGSPWFAMLCSTIGVILNCILNPLFMLYFDMGMAGAAWATVASQFASSLLTLVYLSKFKTFDISLKSLFPCLKALKAIVALGTSQAVNLFGIMLAQIVMNNSIVHYGAISEFGTEIPLACVGIIIKVNSIYIAIVVGIAQGAQPLLSFGYGAGMFHKVAEILQKCLKFAIIISVCIYACYQIFPRQILSLFGADNELYYRFGVDFFRIFMFTTVLNGIQPVSGNFFASIGKPFVSVFIALTRQMLFLIPLVLILPRFFQIKGILFAGPIADFLAFIITMYCLRKEMKELRSRS